MARSGRWLSVRFWARKRVRQTSQSTVLPATSDPERTFMINPMNGGKRKKAVFGRQVAASLSGALSGSKERIVAKFIKVEEFYSGAQPIDGSLAN